MSTVREFTVRKLTVWKLCFMVYLKKKQPTSPAEQSPIRLPPTKPFVRLTDRLIDRPLNLCRINSPIKARTTKPTNTPTLPIRLSTHRTTRASACLSCRSSPAFQVPTHPTIRPTTHPTSHKTNQPKTYPPAHRSSQPTTILSTNYLPNYKTQQTQTLTHPHFILTLQSITL